MIGLVGHDELHGQFWGCLGAVLCAVSCDSVFVEFVSVGGEESVCYSGEAVIEQE